MITNVLPRFFMNHSVVYGVYRVVWYRERRVLLVKELIVYAVFTLCFLGAEINCAVIAAALKHDIDSYCSSPSWLLRDACSATERSYALAIAATVTAISLLPYS